MTHGFDDGTIGLYVSPTKVYRRNASSCGAGGSAGVRRGSGVELCKRREELLLLPSLLLDSSLLSKLPQRVRGRSVRD
jgi:hypothetical protein